MTTLSVGEIAQYAATAASKLGISKFDIYGAIVDETSVQVDQGKPKQVKASQRSGVTVRVWNAHNTVGVTSTTDVDELGLALALETAAEASEFGVKDHAPDFSPEATVAIVNDGSQNPAIATAELKKMPSTPVNDLISTLVAAEKSLMAAHPAITSVPYNGLSQRDVERFYINSAGALRTEGHTLSSIYLYTKAQDCDRKPRSAGAYRVSRRFEHLDVQGCLEEAAEKTISHLNYQKIKTGKYEVVFSPEAFLSLLGAFSNLFNAQSILDRQSLSNPEDLGTQIASPLLSVYDDALHPANVGTETFDGEGTPTRRVCLIEQGILKGFLHSAGTAKRMGTQPTGHASMGAKVTVSPHFFHVEAHPPYPQSRTLAAAEAVILIDDLQALHAGVQASQGSFSLPFDGWLIHQGERTSIESATVAGDIRELLNAIVYVEPDMKLTPSGICPQIWVEGLSITGE